MARPIPDQTLIAIEKATHRALGDRAFLTAKRNDNAKFPRIEFTVLAASTKTVLPLGGREFSVHTAVWKSDDNYLFLEGAYGLTLEAAYEEFTKRGVA